MTTSAVMAVGSVDLKDPADLHEQSLHEAVVADSDPGDCGDRSRVGEVQAVEFPAEPSPVACENEDELFAAERALVAG